MIAPDLAKLLYRDMLRIRLLEEQIVVHYSEWEMRCPVHLSIGQEAAAVGSARALRATDYALSGHRSHGHYIAKGGSLPKMIAEIYGRATGCAHGKGGSMHLIDLDCGFLGSAPIVGSTIPIGVGTAFGSRMRGEDRVTMVYFGDGAVETGVFHESLEFAALKKLPVVFLCENNLYSVYSPMEVRQRQDRPILGLAEAEGIECHAGDGNDVEAVYRLASSAVDTARAGRGPVFLELATYRWREHCGPNYDNDIGYRTETEFAEWRARCPIERQRERLIDQRIATADELDGIAAELGREIDAAFAFAKASPFPPPSAMLDDVLAPPVAT